MSSSIPYSEPILLPANKSFSFHKVEYKDGESHSCFMHFHDVGELILFHQVDGHVEHIQHSVALTPPCLVYVPPMAMHNFKLADTEKSWRIVQFSPVLLSALNSSAQLTLLNFQIAQLNDDEYSRMLTLFDWLGDQLESQEHIKKDTLNLIIEYSVCLFNQNETTQQTRPHAYIKKITPFIEHVQQSNNVNISLNQAAKLCNMSPSYFSRYFKKIFHLTFSQYMLTYRLHLACHLLSENHRSVTDIAYELGFSHPSHFIAKFKGTFGITPKQFQR